MDEIDAIGARLYRQRIAQDHAEYVAGITPPPARDDICAECGMKFRDHDPDDFVPVGDDDAGTATELRAIADEMQGKIDNNDTYGDPKDYRSWRDTLRAIADERAAAARLAEAATDAIVSIDGFNPPENAYSPFDEMGWAVILDSAERLREILATVATPPSAPGGEKTTTDGGAE